MGLVSMGLISIGLISVGLISMGLISIGLISVGLISVGLISMRLIFVELISVGLISVGLIFVRLIFVRLISVGLISVGLISVGLVFVGLISVGLSSRTSKSHERENSSFGRRRKKVSSSSGFHPMRKGLPLSSGGSAGLNLQKSSKLRRTQDHTRTLISGMNVDGSSGLIATTTTSGSNAPMVSIFS